MYIYIYTYAFISSNTHISFRLTSDAAEKSSEDVVSLVVVLLS